MSDPEPTPVPEENHPAARDGELDEESLAQVAGGFDPCPEPPGIRDLGPLVQKIRPVEER